MKYTILQQRGTFKKDNVIIEDVKVFNDTLYTEEDDEFYELVNSGIANVIDSNERSYNDGRNF